MKTLYKEIIGRIKILFMTDEELDNRDLLPSEIRMLTKKMAEIRQKFPDNSKDWIKSFKK
jgi:hypothetical protein